MEHDGARPESDSGVTPPAAPEVKPTSPDLDVKVEEIVRRAQLEKIRGNEDRYRQILSEALEFVERSSLAQEVAGDLLVMDKDTKAARDAYQLAMKMDPTNASAERKYGEIILRLAGIHDAAALDRQMSELELMASGKKALLLSTFCPGLGQIVSHQYKKGGLILGAWLIGFFMILLSPGGLTAIFVTLGVARGSTEAAALSWVGVAICVVAHAVSITDANVLAKNTEIKEIKMPEPPVDLPH